MDALSVFAIFLFADLLATATVLPVFLTLWNRIDSRAALAGAICGLLSVVAYGVVTADLSTGIGYLTSPTNEYGLANLEVFFPLGALLGVIFFAYRLDKTIALDELNWKESRITTLLYVHAKYLIPLTIVIMMAAS